MNYLESSNNSGEYKKIIGTSSPGLFIFLLDQSGSMGENNKSEYASSAVNSVLEELVIASRAGDRIKDRCDIGVIGYGSTVYPIVAGKISNIASNPLCIQSVNEKYSNNSGEEVSINVDKPIWVEPKADGTTPMKEAFDKAYILVSQWIVNHKHCFPPVIMNISDGAPDEPDLAKNSAIKLMQLSTDDGRVLLFNAHITGSNESNENNLPANRNSLNNEYARFLFDISSELPDRLLIEAGKAGFSKQPHSRGLVFNAKAETLVKFLRFGSSMGK